MEREKSVGFPSKYRQQITAGIANLPSQRSLVIGYCSFPLTPPIKVKLSRKNSLFTSESVPYL